MKKERFAKFILWIGIIVLTALTLASLFSSWGFATERDLYIEHPTVQFELPILQIILTAAACAVTGGLIYLGKKKNLSGKKWAKWIPAAAAIVLFVISAFFVKMCCVFPAEDQRSISDAALLNSQGNYLFLQPGEYLDIYPFQLGIIFFLQQIYKLTGGANYIVFQYINALANGLIVILVYLIAKKIFASESKARGGLVFCLGFLPLVFYASFVYGLTLGLLFSMLALYLVLCFREQSGKKAVLTGIGVCISIALSILLKENNLIVLIAIVIVLLFGGIEKKRIGFFVLIVCMLLSYKGSNMTLKQYYKSVSGYEVSDGMPKSLHIAMGMQEGPAAEGWFNGFNYFTYLNNDCDREICDEIGKNAISDRAKELVGQPGYALHFYWNKFTSQWNEPTYESFFVTKTYEGDLGTLMQSMYAGKLGGLTKAFMNAYQSLLLICAVYCLIRKRKEWRLPQLLPLLIVLGGIAFHLLWEAKSQYAWIYMVLLTIYAGAGLEMMGRELCEKIEQRKTK